MKRRLAPFLENVTESGLACLFTMVQGNLLALGLGHWLVASRTGIFAGAAATAVILLIRKAPRLVIAIVLGVATGVVDYLVHPGSFGSVATEAVVTGLGAAGLSLLIGTLRRRRAGRVSESG